MGPIRVLLADDHELLRAGVRSLVRSFEGIEVVAETGDGAEALALVAVHLPDVALLDISMPGLSGLKVAARVSADFPGTRSIILSMHVDGEYVREAIGAGASGYLLKDSGKSELEIALRAVARGETYFSPAVTSHLVAGYLRSERGEAAATDPLTPRQREVLRMIAQGLTTKAIAHRLDISVKTVEAHRAQLMDRLKIHDIAGLVRYALRIRLITDD